MAYVRVASNSIHPIQIERKDGQKKKRRSEINASKSVFCGRRLCPMWNGKSSAKGTKICDSFSWHRMSQKGNEFFGGSSGLRAECWRGMEMWALFDPPPTMTPYKFSYWSTTFILLLLLLKCTNATHCSSYPNEWWHQQWRRRKKISGGSGLGQYTRDTCRIYALIWKIFVFILHFYECIKSEWTRMLFDGHRVRWSWLISTVPFGISFVSRAKQYCAMQYVSAAVLHTYCETAKRLSAFGFESELNICKRYIVVIKRTFSDQTYARVCSKWMNIYE